MKKIFRMLVALGLFGVLGATATAQTCDEAWAEYNEFKKRNKMEPSQYALTTYGATVRAACGPEALPVPPGTDTPPPHVRKPPPKPPAPRPPEKPVAPKN